LTNHIVPGWGRLAPLAVESLAIETWFKELKEGKSQEESESLGLPDDLQDQARDEPSLSARAEMQFPSSATGRQSNDPLGQHTGTAPVSRF